MNWHEWMEQGDAPHGKVFYGLIVFFGGLGVAFFCFTALSNVTDASLGWRIAFALPAVFFLSGVLQALERLVLPERAERRSAGLTEGGLLRILIGRWGVLVLALVGCGVSSIVRVMGNPATQDVCDDLRILFVSSLFLCFCLADLAGDTVFPTSMWVTSWQAGAKDGIGGLAKRRRRRRSLF